MKLPKQKESEALKLYHQYWDSYIKGDLETFASTLDEEVEMIGTTESEVAHNKTEIIELFKGHIDQMVGKADMRNRQISAKPVRDMVLINETCDIYVLGEPEWTFYSKLRISTLLHETKSGWKVIQQHGSLPDLRVQEGETLAIDKISRENIELRNAVKRRTTELENKNRELEIEAALERVRAKSMAMKTQSDLLGIIELFGEQLRAVDVRFGQVAFIEGPITKTRDWDLWSYVPQAENTNKVHIPYIDHPYFLKTAKAVEEYQKTGKAIQLKYFTKEEKNTFLPYYLEHAPAMSDEIADYVYATPGSMIVDAFLEEVTVSMVKWDLEPYTAEELAIFERFAKEFRQTYIRFLDIKKAEEQARESEIQLALERVRAKSMAMKTKSDLLGIIELFGEQLRAVDVRFGQVTFIEGPITKTRDWDLWSYTPEAENTTDKILIPYIDHPYFLKTAKAVEEYQKTGQAIQLKYFTKEEKDTFLPYYLGHAPAMSDEVLDYLYATPGQIIVDAFLEEVTVSMVKWDLEPYTAEELAIFERFAKEFRQTYIRFLDIKKAEEQARESEIQLSLERVRAKSMAMKTQSDLLGIIELFGEQLRAVDVRFDHVTFIEGPITKTRDWDLWTYIPQAENTNKVHIPYIDHPYFLKTAKAVEEYQKTGQAIQLKYFTKEEKNTFLPYYFEHAPALPDEILDYLYTTPGQMIVDAFLEEVTVSMLKWHPEPPTEEELEIFERFAKEFRQTYIRFLDIKKAEEQARESEIEAALERVRSRSMGMQKSTDLRSVVDTLYGEFKRLGLIFDNVVIQLLLDDTKDFHMWITSEDGLYEDIIHWPYVDLPVFHEFYEARIGNKSINYRTSSEAETIEFFEEYFKLDAAPQERKSATKQVKSINNMGTYQEHTGIFLMRYTEGEYSEKDKEIVRRFSKVFEQTYTRFLDLQKAEEQAREAQIEASLERVRAKAMSMQNSDELDEVLSVLCEQFDVLGILPMSTHMTVFNFENNTFTFRETGKYGDRSFGEQTVDLDAMDTWKDTVDKWKADKATDVNKLHFPPDTLPQVWDVFHESFASMPEESRITPDDYPDGIYHTAGKHPFGYIGMNQTRPASPEEEQIVIKFANEFGRAYQRFLDLQKAEGQAREAQIEASLEKVRAQSMGMQTSDDLSNVASVMFDEMKHLGGELFAFGIVLCDKDKDTVEQWHNFGNEGMMSPITVPIELDYIHKYRYDQWMAGEELFSVEIPEDYIKKHFDLMFELPSVKAAMDEVANQGVEVEIPDWEIDYGASFKYGYLLVSSRKPFEESHIFPRFAKVFDQAYTRFQDLQKAEAQTREAQIGNALEKVRSHSLAMQSPDELIEVAQLLREEMGALGVEELETSSIYIHDENSGLTQCWFTIKDSDDPDKSVSDQMTMDLQDTWVGRQMDVFYRSDQNKASILMKGNQRIEWIRYCEGKSDLFGNNEFYGETIPERTYHLYKFSNGFLGAASPGDISDESWDLMRRATAVFSFAYTRFRDLQKTEESARQSRQQASLDRVRADISSMRTSDDLNRVTPLVWRELTTLGIPFIRCGVFIIHEEEEQVEVYLSKPDGTSLAVMHLSFNSNELSVKTVNAWRNKEVYTQHWSREEFQEWGRSMMEQNQVADMKTYQGAEEAPESLHLHFIPFNQGMLYVGATEPLSDGDTGLAASLAEAFSIAYARYEDFVKLEKAKAGIEDALTELKATQSQLVQQEKLASLGQLTAGIAHEIKNPLNFVNNFSEVSLEMIDEALEELGKTTQDDHTAETTAILADIKLNLAKIHEHGSRANGIVQSMLLHSRGGDGKMEPTPLNPIFKEYVNLAFHGMRASKEPINVDIDLQLDDSVGEVPIIAEDLSRVILNLCNNAFDAMRSLGAERSAHGERYSPKLTIRTKSENSQILIEIEDNGPGIPDDIKDKILQPFFTTKKGTQGTGLGLSITNDIIKAHGGKMQVESIAGEGSIFKILLNKQ